MRFSGQYTIWKSDGSVGLGLDSSLPRGASVTSGISRGVCGTVYLRGCGRGCCAQLGEAKADIHHAFRHCPVRPAAWPLLCYTWGERRVRRSPAPFFYSVRFTGLPYTFVGATKSSIISMITFWHGPPLLHASVTCKLSRTSAATSVSPSRRRSWSCQHAASSSWASPWTPLFRRGASLQINLHGGRGRNAPSGSCCR